MCTIKRLRGEIEELTSLATYIVVGKREKIALKLATDERL